jgi:hypothetical protein
MIQPIHIFALYLSFLEIIFVVRWKRRKNQFLCRKTFFFFINSLRNFHQATSGVRYSNLNLIRKPIPMHNLKLYWWLQTQWYSESVLGDEKKRASINSWILFLKMPSKIYGSFCFEFWLKWNLVRFWSAVSE